MYFWGYNNEEEARKYWNKVIDCGDKTIEELVDCDGKKYIVTTIKFRNEIIKY